MRSTPRPRRPNPRMWTRSAMSLRSRVFRSVKMMPGDVGDQIPQSGFAYLPVRVRFMAMACAASVILEASAVTDERLVRARHTLAASLADHEWRGWEQHLVHWPVHCVRR